MTNTRLDTLQINLLNKDQYQNADLDINQIYLITDEISEIDSRFGVCTTAATQANKTVVIGDDDFILTNGATVTIQFKYGNLNPYVNLSVNGLESYPIIIQDQYESEDLIWEPYQSFKFVFYEDEWIIIDNIIRKDYFESSSSSGQQLKEVDCQNFVLKHNSIVHIKFIHQNTVDNPYLNINKTGSFPIYYKGIPIKKNFISDVNFYYTFLYNKDRYELLDPLPFSASGIQESSEIGFKATLEGINTSAGGNGAHAEGCITSAQGSCSHAEGYGTRAEGYESHAEGTYTIAEGDYSHAEGRTTEAKGMASHAEGGSGSSYSATLTNGTIYEIKGTLALGNYSHAEGEATLAYASSSHAEGRQTLTEGDYSHAEGYQTIAAGRDSHTEGTLTKTTGLASHAEGYDTQATGQASHAEGQSTEVSELASHAEGYETKATGQASHAEGQSTEASGFNSHAEGHGTVASGNYSHAEGYYTNASNYYSHAEGYYTIASSNYSHAEGYSTEAQGNASHAEGYDTTATGSGAHAEGYNTIAEGNYSHASGIGTKANAEAQTVVGKYNTSDSNQLFIVGNGTGSSAKSNAFTVDKNGNAVVKNNTTVGGKLILKETISYGTTLPSNPVEGQVFFLIPVQ